MRSNSRDRHSQPHCDFFVALPLSDQGHDLRLPRAELAGHGRSPPLLKAIARRAFSAMSPTGIMKSCLPSAIGF
jgi:hypothetical protein